MGQLLARAPITRRKPDCECVNVVVRSLAGNVVCTAALPWSTTKAELQKAVAKHDNRESSSETARPFAGHMEFVIGDRMMSGGDTLADMAPADELAVEELEVQLVRNAAPVAPSFHLVESGAAQQNFPDVCRVLMMGCRCGGKTTLIKKFTTGEFTTDHAPTIGVEFVVCRMASDDGTTVRVQLWEAADIPCRVVPKMNPFWHRAACLVIVFDVTDRRSFEDAESICTAIDARNSSGPHVTLTIVGNKVDLPREVSADEAERFSDEVGATYHEVSAHDSESVERLFGTIVETWHAKMQSESRRSRKQEQALQPGETG